MSYIDNIRESIKELASEAHLESDNPYSIVGTVHSVDLLTNTCTVQPQDTLRTLIQNVLLSSDSRTPAMFVPAIGTQVTVNLYGQNSGYIAQHGSVKTVSIASGNVDFGGFVKVGPNTDKINNLENKVNAVIAWIEDFATNYNSHVHAVISVGNPSGPVSSIETKTSEPVLTITQQSELENTAATHGNGVADKSAYMQQLDDAALELKTAEAEYTRVSILQDTYQITMLNQNTSFQDYQIAKTNFEGLQGQVDAADKNRGEKQKAYDFLIQHPKQ